MPRYDRYTKGVELHGLCTDKTRELLPAMGWKRIEYSGVFVLWQDHISHREYPEHEATAIMLARIRRAMYPEDAILDSLPGAARTGTAGRPRGPAPAG